LFQSAKIVTFTCINLYKLGQVYLYKPDVPDERLEKASFLKFRHSHEYSNLLNILCIRIYGVWKHDSGDVLGHPLVMSLEGDEPTAGELFQPPDYTIDGYMKGKATLF